MSLDIKLASQGLNELLWETGESICTAESCTAGRIAAAITATPGSSDYFRGGLVCYTNEIKTKYLGVSAELIAEKTPVCEEVVCKMAEGALRMFDSTYAVAISGYAGPFADATTLGATMIVGTIWIAVSDGQRTVTRMLSEDNGRERNLSNATREAFQMLTEFIKERHQAAEEA